MATYSKQLLSQSVNGKQIVIAGSTADTATLVHTAPAGVVSMDEVYLYASNMNLSSQLNVTVLWGGTVVPNDASTTALTNSVGRVLLVDGKLIQNGLAVKVYANGTTIVVDGFVNRITN